MKLPWTEEKCKAFFEKYRYVLLVLAVGLIFLLLPADREAQTTQEEASAQTLTTEVWLDREERRLAAALSAIDGVGETLVVLTLESGPESVLASDVDGERQETVIVSTGSGHEETVTVQELSPRLQGALIVCQGGGNDKVRLLVLQAVEALTGLDANQISICKGMGGV
ncbi:MAG: stage III sporulation protein AG [Oscillospiraceae bacterium]|nr:stage III sporulation protein AG [Oscillospiraceae bacterium]